MAFDRPAPALPDPLSPLVDAHTHLDACGATDAATVKEIVDRAESVGVAQVVTVADDLAAARFAVAAAHWDPRVYAAVALHPTRANALDDAAQAELEELVADERVVAVGETGLDYFWPGKLEGCATVDEQKSAFAWHIALAKKMNKPLMIHNRDANSDTLAILRSEGAPNTVIFHCFSGDAEMAKECVDLGFYLSFSGTVSFRNAKALHAAARLAPDELLLVETDAPYLAPHPFRGAPNESYCLPYTASALAELRGQDRRDLAVILTQNAKKVFALH